MNMSQARRIGLFSAIAALFLLPSFLWGPGASHSAKYNYIWTSQFGAAIAQGNLYPRWLPSSFEGLGSPAFYFYPPLAYWVSGMFDAVGISTQQAINLSTFVFLLLSGMSMHRWLSERGTRPLTGAILYMVAPYHLMDFYVRGALAEFAAFVWLPLIALSIGWLPQKRGAICLALSYAGLIITHLPMAMLAGFFLIAPLVLNSAWKDRSHLPPAVAGGALALALSAFYLLPALTLQSAVASELLWTPWYQPASWSILNPHSLLVGTALPFLIAGLAILCLPSKSIWTVIAIIASLASLGLIPFIWGISPLSHAQFPWRLLAIIEFAGITAIASSRINTLLLGLGASLVTYSLVSWTRESADMLRNPINYEQLSRDMPDAAEYLPTGFDLSLVRDADRSVDLHAYRDLPSGPIIVVREAGEIMVRRAAFPIWRITRDDRDISYAGPVIHFQAQPGIYKINRVYIWQEIVGSLISIAAAILLLGAHLRRSPSARSGSLAGRPLSAH